MIKVSTNQLPSWNVIGMQGLSVFSCVVFVLLAVSHSLLTIVGKDTTYLSNKTLSTIEERAVQTNALSGTCTKAQIDIARYADEQRHTLLQYFDLSAYTERLT